MKIMNYLVVAITCTYAIVAISTEVESLILALDEVYVLNTVGKDMFWNC
jgi:hypothetical protein